MIVRLWLLVMLFLTCLLLLGLNEDVKASPLGQQGQVDIRAEVFFRCVDKLQLEIELGLKPDLSSEQALNICSIRTEQVIESLAAQSEVVVSPSLEVVGY